MARITRPVHQTFQADHRDKRRRCPSLQSPSHAHFYRNYLPSPLPLASFIVSCPSHLYRNYLPNLIHLTAGSTTGARFQLALHATLLQFTHLSEALAVPALSCMLSPVASIRQAHKMPTYCSMAALESKTDYQSEHQERYNA